MVRVLGHGPDADCRGMVEGHPSLGQPAEARPVAPVAEDPAADDHRRGSAVGGACYVAKLGPARPSVGRTTSWPSRTVPGWSHEDSALRAISLIPSRRRSGAAAVARGPARRRRGGAGAGVGAAAGVSGTVGSAGTAGAGAGAAASASRERRRGGGPHGVGQPLPAALAGEARAPQRRILRELRQPGHGVQPTPALERAGAELESPPTAAPTTANETAKAAAAARAMRTRVLIGIAPAGCSPA